MRLIKIERGADTKTIKRDGDTAGGNAGNSASADPSDSDSPCIYSSHNLAANKQLLVRILKKGANHVI
jgi:hypothetical protein